MLRARRPVLTPFALVLALVFAGTACRQDPEVAKQRALERGNAYVEQRKFAEATVEYRKAIQQDIRFGEGHYRLGLTYERMEDRANALREFGTAADLMPGRVDVQLKAGQYYLFASRFEEARKIAERLLDKDVRNVEAHLLLANALAGMNQIDAAASQVEESIGLEPGNVAAYSHLAALEWARGNPSKAEEAFRNALVVAPRSIDARIGLANVYWSAGRLPDAERELKEALAIEPRHVMANRTLAALYVVAGRMAEAEGPLKIIADADAKAVAPRLALADYYLALGRDDQGVKLLEAVAQQKDGATPATVRLAQHEFSQGQKAAAYARIDKTIAADLKSPQPQLLKAAFLLQDGKADEALATAKAAVARSPKLARAHFAVGSILVARRQVDEARAAFQEALKCNPRFGPASLEIAKIDLARGQADTAVRYADEAIRTVPQNPEAHAVLVQALMASGDRDRAMAALRPLQARFGNTARVQALTGQVALSRDDRQAARKAFEQALAVNPRDDSALSGLIGLDLEAGRKAEAQQRVEARLTATPRDPFALTLAGRVYGALGMDDKAESTWKAVVAADPGNLEGFGALCRIYYRQKRLDQALAETEKLAQQQPSSAGVQTLLGFLLEVQGRAPEAQKRYERALQLDPHAAAAANNLAWLYANGNGNLEQALQLAQTAKASLPDAPEVNDTLGWVYYKKGMRELAIGPLEQAVRAMPTRATYHYHLGLAYLGTNNWVKARASLEQALELDPGFEGAAHARQVLSSIQ